jgi:rod shape-determining protein MreC
MFDFIKRHKLAIFFIILFFASVSMYSKNLKTKSDLNRLQRFILDSTLPVQKFIQDITSFVYNAVDHYFFLVEVKKKNVALKSDVEKLKARIDELRELDITNKRLEKLLDFKKNLKDELISAQVISRGASSWLNTIIVDKGKNDGIIPGLAVVTERGIIGHTLNTSNNYSQVLLIVDKNSAVDVINQRSRAKGIVKGYKNNLCRIDYVLSKEDVNISDIVITSGMDGIFPKGLLVGEVIDIAKNRNALFLNAVLKPFVDFDKLEEVLIIIKKEEQLEEIRSIEKSQ